MMELKIEIWKNPEDHSAVRRWQAVGFLGRDFEIGSEFDRSKWCWSQPWFRLPWHSRSAKHAASLFGEKFELPG